MNKDYVQAQAQSYANQGNIFTIPAKMLRSIFTIPLGFQPLGIASRGNRIAIAAYFEPAICLADITSDDTGLHFKLEWIRGVRHGKKSVRLFSNFLIKSEANRAQTVNFETADSLWVSRNGDRTFFKICRSAEGCGWVLSREKKTLPGQGMMHSALLRNDIMETIESTVSLKTWSHCQYDWPSLNQMTTAECEPFTYGIAFYDDGINTPWVITDYRIATSRKGICYGNRLIVPGIYGNGLCFLPDESMLVTRYGQASGGPFNGEPGALIYVPAALISR